MEMGGGKKGGGWKFLLEKEMQGKMCCKIIAYIKYEMIGIVIVLINSVDSFSKHVLQIISSKLFFK